MDSLKGFVTLGSVLVALTASACGGTSDDEPKCSPPSVTGTPFGFQGTATVHGTGRIPAGAAPDGAGLELLVNTGNASYGVLPSSTAGLFHQPTLCGPSFSFELDQMEAGTYRLDYEIYATSSDMNPSATGTSTNTFTVTDGANVEFDPTF